MELTIAILSTVERMYALPNVVRKLSIQAENKPVEVICLIDNKVRSISEKRNDCLSLAQGKFITFVDDGDNVAADYIDCLLDSIDKNPDADVIVFEQSIKWPWHPTPKVKYYGIEYDNKEHGESIYSTPNRYMCFRMDVIKSVLFKDVDTDDTWMAEVKPLLSKQVRIDKILYYHIFEGQKESPFLLPPPEPLYPVRDVDVIIMSCGKIPYLFNMTEEICLGSLLESEKESVRFKNVIVVESFRDMRPYKYKGSTKTIYPDIPFNYAAYANIGLKECDSEYVCISNNDVRFTEYWATRLIHAMEADPTIYSASAFCPYSHPHLGVCFDSGSIMGYEIRKHVTGWCILHRRKVFDIIGNFDEQFKFWFVDNDYAEQLRRHKLKHVLVTSAVVHHVEQGGKTAMTLPKELEREMTYGLQAPFKSKWAALQPAKQVL